MQEKILASEESIWNEKLLSVVNAQKQEPAIREYRLEYERFRQRGIDIIVPVYGDTDATEKCLQSVLERTAFPFRLVVINDRSPEPGMGDMLADIARDERVLLLENETNLGFTGTVNRGFACSDRDVVILNSDTEVCAGWLENMVRAASSHPTAATVTPYSSNAGVFTLFPPEFSAEFDYQVLAEAVRQMFAGKYMTVPTGHGFCMLIRRMALDRVGFFDEARFARGYGEENDFCMRCRREGMIHIVDASTYILHRHHLSFKSEAERLEAEHRVILDELYPEYTQLVEAFKRDPDWKREKCQLIDRVRAYLSSWPEPPVTAAAATKKRLLVAMHRGKGGSILNRLDMIQGLSEECDAYLLTGDWNSLLLEAVIHGNRIPVRKYKLTRPLGFTVFEREDMRAIYAELLFRYQIDYVNMSHLLGQTFDLAKECVETHIPIIFITHDYYAVCPNYSLLDPKNRYCGGICQAEGGRCSLSPKWIGNIPDRAEDMLPAWRLAMEEYLGLFDRICSPSAFCADVIRNTYPSLSDRIQVIEHGRDFGPEWRFDCRYPTPREKIRVLIPGNIGPNKGLDFLMKLLELDGGKLLELHIAGLVAERLGGPGVVLHGEYTRETLPALVKEIKPHYGMIPSIFPETYCHTLTELWAMGMPVFVFNVGVPEARMEKSGAGWICPVEDVEAFYSLITQGITEEAYNRARDAACSLSFPGVRDMARQYLAVFKEIKEKTEHASLSADKARHLSHIEQLQRYDILNKMCKAPATTRSSKSPMSDIEAANYRRQIHELKLSLDDARYCTRRQVGDMIVDSWLQPRQLWRLPGKLLRLARGRYREGRPITPPTEKD